MPNTNERRDSAGTLVGGEGTKLTATDVSHEQRTGDLEKQPIPSEPGKADGGGEAEDGNSEQRTLHHDVSEKGVVVVDGSKREGEDGSGSVIIVDWKGADDPECPLNWTFRHKWAATAIVSAFTFISPVSSSMVAPAAAQISDDFGITSKVIEAMTISVFVLAYAFGPLFLGPLSEIYGRSRVIQGANLFYLVFNLACGFAKNKGMLIAFRLLAGFGGSAPLAIGGGVLADMWRTEERGQAVALYSLGPLLGPAIGPVAGAWIAEKSTWRWVFWSTSILDAFIQFLGFFYLQETFAPILLERKAKEVRKEVGPDVEVRTIFEGKKKGWKRTFGDALTRPFAMWAHEPIVIILGGYMAFIYGLIYLVLTTLPGVYQGIYGQNVGIAGLHYIALGIGLTGASQTAARALDPMYRYLKARNGGKGEPEFRLPLTFPGSILLVIGLIIYGWTAQKHVFWIVPDIGLVFIGAGMICVFQGIQTYVIDTFKMHAASALAAVSFMRSICGFGFPLFAPYMYDRLGYGWGNSVLALVALVIGVPAGPLIYKFGKRIRGWSKFAHKEG